MTSFSFPGIGIDNITVSKVAFTIPLFGGLKVHWYALIIVFAMILAFLYTAYRSRQEGFSSMTSWTSPSLRSSSA